MTGPLGREPTRRLVDRDETPLGTRIAADTLGDITMRHRAMILGVAVVAFCMASAPFALAQDGPASERHGMRGPGGRDGARALFEFLDLSDQQREAWAAAHRAHGESLRPVFERIRELREQMREELEGGSPDTATVGGYVIAIHDLDGEMEASREELEATIADLLTDEQETKLEAWKAANPGRRHGPGLGGFGGPDGPGGPRGPMHGGPGHGRPGGPQG